MIMILYQFIRILFIIINLQISYTTDFHVEKSIIDLSKLCENTIKLNYLLTHGMGTVDGTVLVINSLKKNCTVNFHTESVDSSIMQIIVLEEMSTEKETYYSPDTKINIYEENHGTRHTKIAPLMNFEHFYMFHTKNRRSRLIVSSTQSPGLKITATSGRIINGNENCAKNEVLCWINDEKICVDHELECDGNINCGKHGKFDELDTQCNFTIYKNLVIASITLLMLLVIIALILWKCCFQFIPNVPKQFFSVPAKENRLLIIRAKDISENIIESNSGAAGDKLDCKFNFGNKKRLTTNSPIELHSRKRQLNFVGDSFSGEKFPLEINRKHKIKENSTIFFSS